MSHKLVNGMKMWGKIIIKRTSQLLILGAKGGRGRSKSLETIVYQSNIKKKYKLPSIIPVAC